MKAHVDKKWKALNITVLLYNRSTKPSTLPDTVDAEKDVLDTNSIFWFKVGQEFDQLHHEDPLKFRIMETWGMLKCVRGERKILLRNMKNMISFYQKKIDVLDGMIRERCRSGDGRSKLTALLGSHKILYSDRVDELKLRFAPYLQVEICDDSDVIPPDFRDGYASDSSDNVSDDESDEGWVSGSEDDDASAEL